ncbi:MAG: hypothetical protein KC553_03835 [Nitrospina sp.]|nr:hypothetical protein [Nitrospina sp.]
MIRKRRVTGSVLILVLIAALAGANKARAAERELAASKKKGQQHTELIPQEPGWKSPSYRGWELLSIPGLISTYYDIDLDGQLDYAVIRKIIKKVESAKVSIKEAIKIARVDHLSIYVSHPTIYFTNKYPLFYCRGLDFRKNCENIWVDVGEDGLNGNETLYTLAAPSIPVR